jgi:uncharacterized membrane protein YphA (DoxX/SURF4 family)/uncharacterized membrane protein
VSGILVNSPAILASAVPAIVAIPSTVIWGYSAAAVIFLIWLAVLLLRGDWQKARVSDKLILLGLLFYAAPMAAFGTEHFTLTDEIATLVPSWIPWHHYVALFVGACFIAAALSLVTRIQTRLAASLLAITFFLFVMLMDVPGWAQIPHDRFVLILSLRELSFSAGALALAASLTPPSRARLAHIMATYARYVIGITLLVYSFEQFRHGDHVPGVPLERLTPPYIWGDALWSYLAAVGYAITGAMLMVGKKTRAAAAWAGLTVLFIELVVYLPIGIVDRASLDNGLNYVFDTLLFCGAVILLTSAMPRESSQEL